MSKPARMLARRAVLVALAAAPAAVALGAPAVAQASTTPTCDRCGHVWWGLGDMFAIFVDARTDRWGTICQECARGTPTERKVARCSDCGIAPAAYFAAAPHGYWCSYLEDAWETETHCWEGRYSDFGQRCGHCARARHKQVVAEAEVVDAVRERARMLGIEVDWAAPREAEARRLFPLVAKADQEVETLKAGWR